MSILNNVRKQTGYSAEEAYFYEEDQKLIKKIRSENSKITEGIEDSLPKNVIDARERFASKEEGNTTKKSPKAA